MTDKTMSCEPHAPVDASPQVKAEVRRSVLLLAWPAVIEMLLQMSVGIADMVMVGRLGAAALASVEITNRLINLAIAIFAAISTGATALVARHIGADEPGEANLIARQSFVLVAILGVLVGLGGVLWAEPLTEFMLIFGEQSDPEVVVLGGKYLEIVAYSMPLSMILLVVNGILRGAGDTKTPMWVTGLVNILNIFGNYLLIFGKFGFPALGVAGAAWATAISRAVGGIIVLVILFRGHNPRLRLSIKDRYYPDWPVIRRVMRIGVPAAVEQFVLRAGQLLYGMIVAGMGTTVLAAHAIALTAESLSFMPGSGFGLAAMTLVGQNLGAEEPKRAEISVAEAGKTAMYSMGIMGIIFFLWAEPIIKLFTADPAVIPLASLALRIVAISQPALAWTMVISGGLRGAGDTKYVMYIMAAGIWGLRVPLAYFLGSTLGLGLAGAWYAMIVDLFIRTILFGFRFRHGGWKQLAV